MPRESGPSPEEMGLKPEELRIISDAELIKGGARMKEGGRIEATEQQVKMAEKEMAFETLSPEEHKKIERMDSDAMWDLDVSVTELERRLKDGIAGVDADELRRDMRDTMKRALGAYEKLVSLHNAYKIPQRKSRSGEDFDGLKDKYIRLKNEAEEAMKPHWTEGIRNRPGFGSM